MLRCAGRGDALVRTDTLHTRVKQASCCLHTHLPSCSLSCLLYLPFLCLLCCHYLLQDLEKQLKMLQQVRGAGGDAGHSALSAPLGGGLGAGLAAYGQTASDRVLALPGLFGGGGGRGGAVGGSDALSSRAAAADAATRVDSLLAELASDVRLLVAAANEEFNEARNDPVSHTACSRAQGVGPEMPAARCIVLAFLAAAARRTAFCCFHSVSLSARPCL